MAIQAEIEVSARERCTEPILVPAGEHRKRSRFGRAHRSTSLGLHPASARRTRGPEIRRLSCLEIRNLDVENPTDSWSVVLANQVASLSMVQPAGIK